MKMPRDQNKVAHIMKLFKCYSRIERILSHHFVVILSSVFVCSIVLLPTLLYADDTLTEARVLYVVENDNNISSELFEYLTTKLDDIKGYGITDIVLSPVYKTERIKTDTETFFAPLDYEHIDDELGILQDLIYFIDIAHKKGLRILFEIVTNCLSNEHPFTKDQSKKKWFHNETMTKDATPQGYLEKETISGLADLAQEYYPVRHYLTRVHTVLAQKTGCDGFLLKNSERVPHFFWKYFSNEIHRKLGDGFILIGDISTLLPSYNARYLEDDMDMILDKPLSNAMINVLSGTDTGIGSLSNILNEDGVYKHTQRLSPFFIGGVNNSYQMLILELTFLMRGNPSLFTYDPQEDLPQITKVLSSIRKTHPSLESGYQLEAYSSNFVYAFLRVTENEETLVIFNKSADTEEITIQLPSGHRFYGKRILTDILSSSRVICNSGKIIMQVSPEKCLIFSVETSGKSQLLEDSLKKRAEKKLATLFEIYAPSVSKVAVAGVFNNWNKETHIMKRDSNGVFSLWIDLPAGEHQYKYVADDDWNDLNKDNRVIEAGHGKIDPFESGNTVLAIKDSNVEKVYAVGDFNDWDDKATPMTKNAFGVWTARVDIPSGANLVKFVGDKDWNVFSREPIEVHGGEDMRKFYLLLKSSSILPSNGIIFRMNAPEAVSVDIVASFNNYTPERLKHIKNGMFELTKIVPSGVHYYQFLIDGGIPVIDPSNPARYTDKAGQKFSVLEIGSHEGDNNPKKKEKTNVRKVTFMYNDPDAQNISIAGSFNNWTPDQYNLTKDDKGVWNITLEIEPGKILYQYIIDGGVWRNDPDAHSIVEVPGGAQVSARIVK